MNSRRLIDAPKAQYQPSYRLKPAYWKGADVRFGSKADGAQADVRFTPNSRHHRSALTGGKTVQAQPPSIHNHGCSTIREQAMAKFKTQRQIEKTANAAVFSGLGDRCGSH
jgi:hypothetical protein